MILEALQKAADMDQVNLVLTVGGTGFSPRDVTPEATLSACEKMAPGIAECMRAESRKITRRAMLSRAVAGIRKKTLIINLPGSEKGARENLEAVLEGLGHGLDMLMENREDCAGQPDIQKL
jgi:molybdenum cofactor synthesis domain-containing protein